MASKGQGCNRGGVQNSFNGTIFVKGQQQYAFFRNFENFKKLGSGGFGIVVRADKIGTGTQCALKLIPFKNNMESDMKTLDEAKRLYTLPEHRSVIRCDSYWSDAFTLQEHRVFLEAVKPKKDEILSTFPTNERALHFLCIQMELFGGGGTLKTWLKNRKQVDLTNTVNIFLQITSGIAHIHSHGLIHRDLKPLNILFDGRRAKISDLGYAANHSAGDYNHTRNAGAALYQAPEQGYGQYGKQVDYFALGLILYELFHIPAQRNVGEALTALKYSKDVVLNESLGREYPDVIPLIRQLLSLTPHERPSAEEIEKQVKKWPFLKKRIGSGGEPSIALNNLQSEITCNTCYKMVPGLRFQCSVCVDYFLCEDCEKMDIHPAVHDLIKIKTPSRSKIEMEVFGENSNGCAHYDRRCKIQCPDKGCGRYFPCRLCHDESIKGHKLNRKEVVTIKCTICQQIQVPGPTCRACGIKFAEYYCAPCTLYDDDEVSSKLIFHCDRCGLCRKRCQENAEYEHCDKCEMCYPTVLKFESEEVAFPEHKCTQNAGKSQCPVCDKAIHDSIEPAMLLPCHHYVHILCRFKFPTGQDKCPVCGNW